MTAKSFLALCDKGYLLDFFSSFLLLSLEMSDTLGYAPECECGCYKPRLHTHTHTHTRGAPPRFLNPQLFIKPCHKPYVIKELFTMP